MKIVGKPDQFRCINIDNIDTTMKKSEALDLCKVYLSEGFSIRHICLNQLKGKISYPTVVKYLRSFIEELTRKRQLEFDKKVAGLYRKNGKINVVVKTLKTDPYLVKDSLKRSGIKENDWMTGNQRARKNKVDETYFEKIDTLEKAYYLGLMYSDGVVHMRTRPCKNVAKISLTEKDSYILESLNKAINHGRPMYRGIYKDGRGKPYVVFSVNSRKICLDLIRLGCIMRKSKTLQWPSSEQVPDHLLSSFIRGVFDGDGGMHFSKQNSLCISLTTSHSFGESFERFYREEFGGKCYIYREKNYSEVHLNVSQSKIDFCRFLYKDKRFKVCLKRKLEVVNRYLDFLGVENIYL